MDPKAFYETPPPPPPIANTRGSVPLAFAFAMATFVVSIFRCQLPEEPQLLSPLLHLTHSGPTAPKARCHQPSRWPPGCQHCLAKFQRAPAAFSFASSDPFRANCTRGSMPPAFAMCDLVVSILHCQVPESPSCPLSFASSDPFRANCTRGSMPPAFAMATLLSALIAKFRRAPAAFSFASSDPFRANLHQRLDATRLRDVPPCCQHSSLTSAKEPAAALHLSFIWPIPGQLHQRLDATSLRDVRPCCQHYSLAKYQRAPAAFSFASSDPFRANCTKGSMPPAFAMGTCGCQHFLPSSWRASAALLFSLHQSNSLASWVTETGDAFHPWQNSMCLLSINFVRILESLSCVFFVLVSATNWSWVYFVTVQMLSIFAF